MKRPNKQAKKWYLLQARQGKGSGIVEKPVETRNVDFQGFQLPVDKEIIPNSPWTFPTPFDTIAFPHRGRVPGGPVAAVLFFTPFLLLPRSAVMSGTADSG